MKKRSFLPWLLSLAVITLFTRASCFPPEVPVCVDYGNCPQTPLIQEVDPETGDTLTQIIVQLQDGMKGLDVLGKRDTAFSLVSEIGREWHIKSDPGFPTGPFADTVIIGKKAFLENLNDFFYEDNEQRIEDVMPIDTCKCDQEIFLMRARTPPEVNINNGIAKGKSTTREENNGSILAAGFNYNIKLQPFNNQELITAVNGTICPGARPPSPSPPNDLLGGKKIAVNGTAANEKFNPETCGPVAIGNPLRDRSVTVAVVDTGFDPSYRFKAGNTNGLSEYVWFSEEIDFLGQDVIEVPYGAPLPGNGVDNGGSCFPDDYYGYDFIQDHNKPDDFKGHATHMIDKILKANQPNRPPVRIMPLKFGGYRDGEFECDLFAGICAINYAAEQEADAINLSFGWYSQILHDVFFQQLLEAQKKDIAVVTSAGNDNVFVDNCYHWPSGFSQVQELDNVISVAALAAFTSTDDFQLADYSNYGLDIDLAAPGTNIEGALVGSFDQTIRLDGTSMAAAVVSRRVAMLRYDENNQRRSASLIKELLLTEETLRIDRACVGQRRALDPQRDPTLLPAIGY